MKLIASRSMTYATRRLQAGDPFTARTAAHGRALIATKRAKRAVDEPEAKPTAELDALRAEYQDVVGKRPYHGWDADALAEKIAEERAKD